MPAGDKGVHEDLEHLLHVPFTDGAPGDTPQIELMRRAGVKAVDGVTAIGDAGTDDVAKPVVVVGQRDDPRPAFDSDRAVPRGGESVDSQVDEELDGMGPGIRISEVTSGQVALKLLGGRSALVSFGQRAIEWDSLEPAR